MKTKEQVIKIIKNLYILKIKEVEQKIGNNMGACSTLYVKEILELMYDSYMKGLDEFKQNT